VAGVTFSNWRSEKSQPNDTRYSYDSIELPVNTGKAHEEGNMGHRPGPKGGYFPDENASTRYISLECVPGIFAS
jgi:hypothetical protein